MRALQIISINHLSHSTKERLAANLSETLWTELFVYMKFDLQVEGFVHLRTCNRIEIYYEADRDLRDQIIDKWMSLHTRDKAVDRSSIDTYFGTNICMHYLLTLSAGLYSAIPGDDQIVAQLKKAFLAAGAEGVLSTLLERAFQGVMKCHKQICNDTDYRKQTVSLAYHGLKSIYNHISKSELLSKRLLIIGAGDMAAQVLKYIDRFRFHQIAICNRTIDKAIYLASGKEIDVVDYDTINTSNFDIVISCTDQGYDIINGINALDYYIDLSLRSATIDQIDIPHILLLELQSYLKSENVKRFSSVAEVKKIVTEHTSVFSEWVTKWEMRQNSLEVE